ncbi:TetR family transcriptional regulator C-terminal domain-containing protein [Mycobacterium sp. E2327]|uniref:TetR family transcriptional regulator C-terminal domain-containing protein n=1 Tax=Mycobacterium sp. E2327 TaxID=1834132 RepID=UPI0018D292B4|nr:TetR family transcriptional regulator C-terminal domain-containing protein [Mycobacterium sp. E2327]
MGANQRSANNSPDEEDVVRSVINEQAQALLRQQRCELQAVTSVADLERWRDRLVTANARRGGAFGCVLGSMVSQLADRDERCRLLLAGYFAEWQRLVAAALRRLQTCGELARDANPEELATGLIAALQGGYVLSQASHDVDDMAAAIDVALSRIRSYVIAE